MKGYVYLIGNSLFGWYKIGKSKAPRTRVEDLGILLPFKVEVIAVWKASNYSLMEKAMHEKYSEHHINGEWFRFEPEKIQEIINNDIPESARIADSSLYSFSNVERDAPAGKVIKINIKNDFTDEEKRIKREQGIAKTEAKKASRLTAALIKSLDQARVLQQVSENT